MEMGLVHKIDIDDEMQQAYLDYAMSVIVARALPDARDGLKPVHRRILYAMYDMGLRTDSSYKKSARIVGEVLGKYHPHGDMAVYEAMARMAQDFSMRYMLVDGQGNFGSVDGDPPAAMRYTEARLEAAAQDMLADITKNTVNFEDNFDGTLTEPAVLPAALPNLLVNGATGIAVGMATSIPPHNLGEVVDALEFILENWDKLDDINVEDLMRFIQGPDFPTGGIILQESGEEGLASAYGTGRGRVVVRARAHLEEMERGRNRIIVTELPYMTNKSSLIERIAELVREERLQGIIDLRDESDRQGMRIVIELNKTADPQAVLRDLYKHTPMQSTFSINMLALVGGEPRLLSLKQALRVYVDHRLEIIRRRSEHDLERARHRAHILEGLRVALKNLDEVIEMIRKAPDVETARVRLMKRFKLSEIQAQAILDMPLRRLAALERKKIEEEYKEVQALIKELEGLLRSPKKMRQVVGDELLTVKEAYGDRRRTQIIHLKEGEPKISLLTTGDMAPDKTIWLSITANGLISRSLEDKPPRLGGQDTPRWLVRASTRDNLYLVCEQGEAAAIALHAIPEAELPGNGAPVTKVTALRDNNRVAALFTLPPKDRPEDRYVLTATHQGMVKKSPLSELPGPSAGTFTLVRVNEGDRLGWLGISNGQNEVLLATTNGMAIRFSEEEVRPMGLVAAGVMGIKLGQGDEVAGMALLPHAGEVFLLASDGTAKRVPANQFPKQGRYGQGIVGWKLPPKTQVVAMTIGKGSERAILFTEKLAPKSIRLDEAPVTSRTARGHALREAKTGGLALGLILPLDLAPEGEKGREGERERGGEGDGARTPRRAATKPVAAQKPVAGKAVADGNRSGDTDDGTKREARGKAKTAVSEPASGKTAPKKAVSQKTAPGKAEGKPAPQKRTAARKTGATIKKAAEAKPAGAKKALPKESAAKIKPAAKVKPAAAEAKPTAKALIAAAKKVGEAKQTVEAKPTAASKKPAATKAAAKSQPAAGGKAAAKPAAAKKAGSTQPAVSKQPRAKGPAAKKPAAEVKAATGPAAKKAASSKPASPTGEATTGKVAVKPSSKPAASKAPAEEKKAAPKTAATPVGKKPAEGKGAVKKK